MRSNFNIANSHGVFSCSCSKAFVKIAFLLIFFFPVSSYSQGSVFASGSYSGTGNVYTGIAEAINCAFSGNTLTARALYSNSYAHAYNDGVVNIPSGSTIKITSLSGFNSCSSDYCSFSVSGSNRDSTTLSRGSTFSCSPPSGASNWQSFSCSFQCVATYTFDNILNLPQCSQPVPISAPACKGGQGLLAIGGSVHVGNVFGDMFGDRNQLWSGDGLTVVDYPQTGAAGLITFSHYQNTPFDTLSTPIGQCVNNTEGQIYQWLICPLGFEDDFEEPSSSSSEPEQSSSSATGESSSSHQDLCVEFPTLPGCSDGDSETGGIGGGEGGTSAGCTDLRNCDWARIDVQLKELGVSIEIRDNIRNIIGLLNNGYNLSQQQLQALQSLRNDLVGSVGSGANEIVNAIRNLENSLGNGDGGDIADGVADGLGKFAGDTTGQGVLDSLLGSFGIGDGGGGMGDSLGDGSGIRGRIKNSVGIDSASFSFFGNSDNCPVFDFSFDTGFMGIGCTSSSCKLNLCNAYGVNVASILRSFLWFTVILSCLFMNLHTIKTGGRS